jgi:hypothetical protein
MELSTGLSDELRQPFSLFANARVAADKCKISRSAFLTPLACTNFHACTIAHIRDGACHICVVMSRHRLSLLMILNSTGSLIYLLTQHYPPVTYDHYKLVPGWDASQMKWIKSLGDQLSRLKAACQRTTTLNFQIWRWLGPLYIYNLSY